MIGAVEEFFELMKKATDMSDISYMAIARKWELAPLGSHESYFWLCLIRSFAVQ